MRLSTNARNAVVNAIATLLAADGLQPYIEIYDTAPPANLTDSHGTLLVTCRMGNPTVAPAIDGTGRLLAIITNITSTYGTPLSYVIFTGSGVPVIDGHVRELLVSGQDGLEYAGAIQQSSEFSISSGNIVAGNTTP